MIKQLPNLITLGNLFCGTIATIFAVESNFKMAALFVVAGIVFDFFDGFVARLLKASGELGKQLDSLADMVTSGVVPGIIMSRLIQNNLLNQSNSFDDNFLDVALIGLILTLGACYRLANFNIDTRQSNSFIGLPTPAMSLFVISLPLIQEYSNYSYVSELITNNYVLIFITVILTYLMNAEIPLFSLKFKNYTIKDNFIKYLFLITSIILIFALNYLSVPLIIIFYIILSVISNYGKKAKL
ncbi:phosphatidylserine synthase [Polaribacter porphyrae]|uniref:Phosphatidylserine synthase n=1 Tax=Polaribacter porphyrae TaxID=1137780 RepID=A0A2S7WTC0_9FLAO|nr:phosphatidylserine synthase [Polaribacter porphyrae]